MEHSFSPIMQNIAFETCNLNAIYAALPVHPDNLNKAVEGIKCLQIRGGNITVPHKTAIIPFLDKITETARRIGAVNTIRLDGDKLTGTNTDASGFIKSLEAFPLKPEGMVAGIIGAGGASRAILIGLAESGVKSIYLHNRTIQKAENLINEFSPQFPSVCFKVVTKETLQSLSLDLLVNTTTVGMNDNCSPVVLKEFKKVNHVVDIIYSPLITPLLKQAKELKIPCINGIEMLLFQGSEAFKFWTEMEPPLEKMRDHLLRHLSNG